MTRTGRTGTTARAGFARVIAVLALVVGIILLQGFPCDGVDPGADGCCPSAGGTSAASVTVSPEGDMSVPQPLAPPESAVVTTDSPDGHFGGVLEVCLIVMVAILLAVAGLRLPVWSLGRRPREAPVVPVRPTRLRAPALVQLCVSRV